MLKPTQRYGVGPRRSAGRTFRNVGITIFVLALVLGGAGVIYTYYFGPSNGVPPVPKDSEASVNPTSKIKPVKTAANARESAAVQTLTSPVAPGSNATISIKTNPESKCVIEVTYGGVAAKDSGLQPRMSDEYGTVNWTWTVAASAPEGTWPVNVTCIYTVNGLSAVVKGDLVVSKSAAPDS